MTTTTSTHSTPTAGVATWSVDPAHTEVGFAVRHLMLSTVRGRFGAVAGQIAIDEADPRKTAVEIEIDVASLDSRNEQRDAHLRSADFFDVENFPNMRFVSTRIEGDVAGDFTITGDLTIRGTTRPIVLHATAEGRGRDPWGNDRAGFSATGKLNRADFGLVWNQVLEAGGVAVGDEVKMSIDVEIVRQAALAGTAA